MAHNDRQGVFEVIDSFAIKRRNQFYLIGKIKEGKIKSNWFVNVPLNSSLSMTIRITDIEEIIMTSEKEPHTLLIVDCDEEILDLHLSMKIGLEDLEITIEGRD